MCVMVNVFGYVPIYKVLRYVIWFAKTDPYFYVSSIGHGFRSLKAKEELDTVGPRQWDSTLHVTCD